MGWAEGFVDWSTRQTDEYVSGTSVRREDAARVGDAYGYDPETFAGVEDYDPETGDVETEYPDWRSDWQATARDVDDTISSDIVPMLKLLAVLLGVGAALYLLQPLLRILAAVVGD